MKEKIQEALIELLEKKPLKHISVKEITTLLKIHRATFYTYFSSRDELSEMMIEDLLYDLKSAIAPAPHLTFEEITRLYINGREPLAEATLFLEHIQHHKKAYRVLLRDLTFQQRFAHVISSSIMQGNTLPEIYTQHMAYGAIGLILGWLENESIYSKEDISMYLTRTIVHSLIDFQQRNSNYSFEMI